MERRWAVRCNHGRSDMGVWERRGEQSQRRKNNVCFGRWIQKELPSRPDIFVCLLLDVQLCSQEIGILNNWVIDRKILL